MAGILNAQYTSVFTRGNTTNMPEPECLFTGDDPLTEVSFKREEVEKKLKKIKASGAPGPDHLQQADGGFAPSGSWQLVRLVETWSSLSVRMSRADWGLLDRTRDICVLANMMNSARDVFIPLLVGRGGSRTWWSVPSCKCPCTTWPSTSALPRTHSIILYSTTEAVCWKSNL